MVIRVSFGMLGMPLRLGVGSMGWVVMSDVLRFMCCCRSLRVSRAVSMA
jgi:hypothetical protein